MTGTIVAIHELTPTVRGLEFSTHPPLQYEAGQYIEADLPSLGWTAFSLASAPSDSNAQLCIKYRDDNEETLKQLVPGFTFPLKEADGGLLFQSSPGRDICFVATGTGVAPFRSMLREHFQGDSSPRRTTLLLGLFDQTEVLYSDEWDQHPSLDLLVCLSDPQPAWDGFEGLVNDALRQDLAGLDWDNTDFYLCGHFDMVIAVRTLLQEKGVSRSAIHHELFIP